MPSNLITGRITEFLIQYPPFSGLREPWIEKTASYVEIIYREDGQYIFKEDEPPGKDCYVLRKGRVDLYQLQENHDALIDICSEGDVFGIRSMLSGEPYKMTAKVVGEALIYLIPVPFFKEMVKENPSVSQFFAFGLASRKVVLGKYNKSDLTTGNDYFRPWITPESAGLMNKIPKGNDLLYVRASVPIREAAQKMSLRKAGSIVIVDHEGKPAGIVTDTDIREKVATGKISINNPVNEIMSAPVITIPGELPVLQVVMKMMDVGVHHLCITEDGTNNSKATGIISNHDLLLSQGNNPAILRKSINQCRSFPELALLFEEAEKITVNYIFSDLPLEFINSIVTSLRDAVISRSIDLAIELIKDYDKENFAWIGLGSEGRGEQVLKTDIDNALIYRNGNKNPDTRENLMKMGQKVNKVLFEAGFKPCPAGIMAHLPEMCLSGNDWKQKFGDWIKIPDPEALLRASIFYDLRVVNGNSVLVEELKDFILNTIDENTSFINFFAKNATINPPPLSFFNQFIVESSGEHKNEFDLKKRAIMPLADAARVLALDNKYFETTGTASRYEMLAIVDKQNRTLFEEAKTGYNFLLKIRARSGLENNDDGRFINIEKLNKIDRKVLKEIFQVIKHLQSILTIRFQLDYFGN